MIAVFKFSRTLAMRINKQIKKISFLLTSSTKASLLLLLFSFPVDSCLVLRKNFDQILPKTGGKTDGHESESNNCINCFHEMEVLDS